MRISDWSSDVCSSDLWPSPPARFHRSIWEVRDKPPSALCPPTAGGQCRAGWLCNSRRHSRRIRPERHRRPLPLPSHPRREFRVQCDGDPPERSEEHTSELQSLMRISYAVFCLKKKTNITTIPHNTQIIT